ncbi:MAG: NAD(P)H:quinone oxidoreductase [Chromatiales bacterium]|nr:NAD(P)H:quinone oxidoreductase [Chromatiales bacterium]
MDNCRLLIIYYSVHGATERMARLIARGIENSGEAQAMLRTVPPITKSPSEQTNVPQQGPPYATLDELASCKGLVIGSPTHFGNMAAPMKHFWDQTSGLWLSSALAGKPAGVFTSTSSLHGGQETTLLSMMLPLFHHGMILCGLPYSENALHRTQSGGTPYGPSHVAGRKADRPIDATESELCIAFGKRIAGFACLLNNKS